jgi:cytochrome c oxidase cbb3-type subunit 4
MDAGVLRGIGTVILMTCFVALCVWAYSPKRRTGFDDAARLPLVDDDSRGEA